MTDEPTDDLEQRLRKDLGEIADAVPVRERFAASVNVVPLAADGGGGRRRSALAAAGVLGAAAAVLIGVLVWPSDDDPAETVATQDSPTAPATTEPPPVTRSPKPTVPPVTTVPEAVLPQTCPDSLALDGVSVRGETLFAGDGPIPSPAADFFEIDEGGIDEGGIESTRGVVFGVERPKGIYQVSETFQVATAERVRPVIDFVDERVAREGPVLMRWAAEGRVEAWISADGCFTFGLSVTGGSPDQNALAASELAFIVDKAGLDPTEEPAIDCPDPVAEPGSRPALFFYCPFDDVDQIPQPVAPRDPNVFFKSPTEALQAVFSTDPPSGWGTGIPLVMRGADVEVVVTDGVARVVVDYDFEAAPINGFSTSAMSLAYLNQLQATLFQFPEIEAIDLDSLCCGEWGGRATRAEWEAFVDRATEP